MFTFIVLRQNKIRFITQKSHTVIKICEADEVDEENFYPFIEKLSHAITDFTSTSKNISAYYFFLGYPWSDIFTLETPQVKKRQLNKIIPFELSQSYLDDDDFAFRFYTVPSKTTQRVIIYFTSQTFINGLIRIFKKIRLPVLSIQPINYCLQKEKHISSTLKNTITIQLIDDEVIFYTYDEQGYKEYNSMPIAGESMEDLLKNVKKKIELIRLSYEMQLEVKSNFPSEIDEFLNNSSVHDINIEHKSRKEFTEDITYERLQGFKKIINKSKLSGSFAQLIPLFFQNIFFTLLQFKPLLGNKTKFFFPVFITIFPLILAFFFIFQELAFLKYHQQNFLDANNNLKQIAKKYFGSQNIPDKAQVEESIEYSKNVTNSHSTHNVSHWLKQVSRLKIKHKEIIITQMEYMEKQQQFQIKISKDTKLLDEVIKNINRVFKGKKVEILHSNENDAIKISILIK